MSQRYSGPILRMPARAVAQDEDLTGLVQRLYREMHELDGVGIAAPQIGVGLAVAVIEWEGRRFDCLNLRIDRPSATMVTDREGCLSLPNREFRVSRHQGVWVAYRTPTWAVRRLWVDGHLAKVFQHEADHLRGICIDVHGREIVSEALTG